jgi:hypothetical protein
MMGETVKGSFGVKAAEVHSASLRDTIAADVMGQRDNRFGASMRYETKLAGMGREVGAFLENIEFKKF